MLRSSFRYCCDGKKTHVLGIHSSKVCKQRYVFGAIHLPNQYSTGLQQRIILVSLSWILNFWPQCNITFIICKVDNMTFKKVTDTSFVCTLTPFLPLLHSVQVLSDRILDSSRWAACWSESRPSPWAWWVPPDICRTVLSPPPRSPPAPTGAYNTVK